MIAPNPPQKFLVRVKRQDGANQPSYWQEFEVPVKPSQNIISVLQYIAANPTTTSGEAIEPVVWDSGCLEEVCGACTMVINGRVRQSCSALVPELLEEADGGPVTLEPMTKFPVVRDLFVDRQRDVRQPDQSQGLGSDRRHPLARGGPDRIAPRSRKSVTPSAVA